MKQARLSVIAGLPGLALLLRAAAADVPGAGGDGALPRVSLAYPAVRTELIHSGFEPLALKHGAGDYFCIGDNLCQAYPEVLSCVAAGTPACRMAFFNRATGKYKLVITNSDHSPLMVTGMMDASIYDIADIQARQ